jgi:hypothetical protein
LTFGSIIQLNPELCKPFLGKNMIFAPFLSQNSKNGTKKRDILKSR